jgi:signal transduction histidine kinase
VQSALKLRQLRSSLREHYDLLKHQRDDLLRLQLQKERLMAFVVHDLKNPVNAMDLHAQLLTRRKDLAADALESAEQIRIAARRLGRMILNLLDLSKGDEGRLSAKKAPLEFPALARAVEAEIAVAAEERGVRLELDTAIDPIEADEDLLQRTLVNLMENAVRHAPRGSIVRLRATRSPAGVEIRVSDAGKGVPPAMRERIFDPFVQVESGGAMQSRGGYGLGLAFCRLAVQAHGGTIRVEDENPGAAFVITLPDTARA